MAKMISRVFLAVDFPKETKQLLGEIQGILQRKFFSRVKWVKKENLHLTLFFAGDLSEKELEWLKNRLKELSFSSFSTTFSSLGGFPDAQNCRIIWLGMTPAFPWKKLAEKVAFLVKEKFSFPQREFVPHVTLGRVKRGKIRLSRENKKLTELIRKIPPVRVKSLVLYSSQLTSRGPQYTKIKEFKLLL